MTRPTGIDLRRSKVGIPPDNDPPGPWICCQIAGDIGGREHYEGWTFHTNPCSGTGVRRL